MSHLDSVIKNFRFFIEHFKKRYHESESQIQARSKGYEEIINSKRLPNEIKLLYASIRENERYRQAELASRISLLYSSVVMATTVKILENSLKILENQFNILEARIIDSKILDKSKDIDDIKKLKAILKAQKEEREKLLEEAYRILEESKKRDLSYIG